jgi:hypothetical protein
VSHHATRLALVAALLGTLPACDPSTPGATGSAAPVPRKVPGAPSADPAVLAEVVGRLPSALPPVGPSALTSASGAPSVWPLPSADVGAADVALQPETKLSSASTERALRASLYAELVLRCRAPDGAALPPDAVTLEFRVAPDGHIDRGSASAVAADPRHADAARCMLRVLRTSDARVPTARGHTMLVRATVPSVD